ncbi:hypothetical protein CK203_025467 [Vitis vinifera]|uniref:Glycoside hydrolase family 31 TIM barrel domain-containing protein n=1 Tax=Vitis vinifera TaxID=29760 RepID=A0A438IZL9_VITVI|nr:hypothetical protein CK203_025467 [Vitis vinifera]
MVEVKKASKHDNQYNIFRLSQTTLNRKESGMFFQMSFAREPSLLASLLTYWLADLSFQEKNLLNFELHSLKFSASFTHSYLQVARTFREKGIPCDVIWMDIDYMDGFRCFTFDQASYISPIRYL